ncbi:uncharacterized protein LOC121404131 [Drosophila obscura]|uniref:uncharacterized protein LOC121404131 n=1 Tax=Drosophila obscura TaxID=7282 RepID=UPI001BB29A0A|nr:uncharacterized protein LOC121404131 [Drosophila obscura]
MASQKIARMCGLFTGLAMSSVDAKGLSLSPVVHAMDQRPSFDAEELSSSTEGSFVAPYKCNLAIQRGFYFSLRMPDWASQFKRQTHDILATTMQEPIALPKEKEGSSSSSQKKLRGCFYEEPLDSKNSIPREDSKQIRTPKIKDDITCGKRVPV